ncbi:hypothetical protein [Massilia aquatica]|uniref:hypothetical protein n=1 Tax=Massilia aquatica TaxID=2609000 RepID=UPI0014211161|nr:hypothetical protein [Massilia aquatica]
MKKNEYISFKHDLNSLIIPHALRQQRACHQLDLILAREGRAAGDPGGQSQHDG